MSSLNDVNYFHFRLYYHGVTLQPVKPCEINVDSEEEINPGWLRQKTVNVMFCCVSNPNLQTHTECTFMNLFYLSGFCQYCTGSISNNFGNGGNEIFFRKCVKQTNIVQWQLFLGMLIQNLSII